MEKEYSFKFINVLVKIFNQINYKKIKIPFQKLRFWNGMEK
jgi:hypothetical protein